MKVLVDTNVILDIVLERQPFVEQAVALLELTRQNRVDVFLSATTITDLYYIVRRAKDRQAALDFLRDLLLFVDIAAVDREVILRAMDAGMTDFEDAVQAASAQHAGIDAVVTRNLEDFQDSGLTIYDPESFVHSFA